MSRSFERIIPIPKPDYYCCEMLWSCYGVDYDFDKWWIDSITQEEIFYCHFCVTKLKKLPN